MEDILVRDKSKQRWIIIVAMFTAFMTQLDAYIVNISLPTIASNFNVTTSEVSRVVLIYLLVLTSTLLVFGKLADKIGFKKTFITGCIIFIIGSLFCGISPNINILIISRVIQAIGGSMLYTAAFAVISKFLPKDIIGSSYGMLSTSAAMGVTAGSPIGGLLTGYFSWHMIFLINIPFGLAAIIIAAKVLPEEKVTEGKKLAGFDILGALLSFFGLITIIYALNVGTELGWTSLPIIILFIISIIFIVSFIKWELRASQPLVDLKLFKNKNFTFANIASFTAFMIISGNVFILPFYLKYINHLKSQEAGLVLLAYSLIYMIVGPISGKLADRNSPNLLCAAGMAIAAVTCFFFAFTLASPYLLIVIIFLMFIAFSVGTFGPPNNKQIMRFAPPDKQGIASGVLNMIKSIGQIIGVSLFEAIFSANISGSVNNLDQISVNLLSGGFQNVYIFAGIICVISAVFSSLISMANAQQIDMKRFAAETGILE